MKNKIKYFVLYPLMLLIVILTLTYDVKELIGLGQRIPFGSSYWKDSLADAISTNKSIKLGTGDSIYYNGVVVTSGSGGGGDVVASANNILTGNNTFSNGNTFTDSLRANGYSLIDDAKITSYLRVTGEVTTDLNFNKGSSTSIGTISTDSLAFITDNTKRIVIDKNGYTVFTDTVQMLDRVYISGNLNVASNIYTIGNITADSIAGIGKFITEVDAITLKGQDTTHFARTDTLTTERVKSKTEFSDVVTFFLSPVFSALVNFANGITTTTITASSTATFNGFTKLGENGILIKEKTYIIPLDTLNRMYSRSLGFDWRNFKGFTSMYVKHDSGQWSDKRNYNLGFNSSAIYTTGLVLSTDSLNVYYYLGAGATGLLNDTAFITVRYTNQY